MDVDGTLLALMLAPAKAYRELLYRPAGNLSGRITERFDIVAAPGRSLSQPPWPGDVVLYVTLGHPGGGGCVVITDPGLTRRPSRRGEPGGWYSAAAGGTHRPRVLDLRRRVPPGCLLLRRRPAAPSAIPLAPDDEAVDLSPLLTNPKPETTPKLGTTPNPVLLSPRFAGDPELNAVLQGTLRLAAPGTANTPAPVRSKGPAVAKVQQALIDLGFPLPRFGPDGLFGSETGGAVTKFKIAMSIAPTDPVVGRLTMSALDERIRDKDGGGGGQPVAGTPTITVANPVVVVRKPYTSPARRRVELRASADFTGTGKFTVSAPGRVRFFDALNAGNAVANGADFTAAQLQAGVVIFADGIRASDKVDDIVVTLTLSAGGKKGAAATQALTAVELVVDAHASRSSRTTLPAPLTAARKLNPGRFVHLQDAGMNHGRAMVTVRAAKPKGFTGALVLEAPGVSPRVRFFGAADEVAAAGQTSLGAKVAAIPSSGGRFWVEGVGVSAAQRDVEVRLGVDGLESDGDRVVFTVVQFSNLQATIPTTQPRTTRLANGPVPAHVFLVGAGGFDEDPIINPPLTLVEGSAPTRAPVELQVTVAPADTPVSWDAHRASGLAAASGGDDHASIVALHRTTKPTVRKRPSNDRQATLLTDNTGTFHVRPYVDCNGSKTFDFHVDREPNIILNLVLGRCTLVRDNSVTHSANFVVGPLAGGGIGVRSGETPFNINTPQRAAIHMNADVDVITGGADGRRAVRNFFGGWINNEVAPETIQGTYTDASVTPNRVHRTPSLFVSNVGAATLPTAGGGRAFAPTDPAPAILAVPLLDSGRANAGTGGDSATLSRSRIRTRTNRPVGERWIVECVDSPSDSDSGTHPVVAAARLTEFNFGLSFGAFLAVWCNTTASSAPTGDPADRAYSVLRQVNWTQRGRWRITPATGAITQLVAPATVIASGRTTSPSVPASTVGVEVRVPVATDSIARDARR